MKRGKRKSSWSCGSVFPDCLAVLMTSFCEVMLAGLRDRRRTAPASPTAAGTCASPLCPAACPEQPAQAAPRWDSESPGSCQGWLRRIKGAQLSMSSSQLFILENPLGAGSDAHTEREGASERSAGSEPGSRLSLLWVAPELIPECPPPPPGTTKLQEAAAGAGAAGLPGGWCVSGDVGGALVHGTSFPRGWGNHFE